MDAKKLLLRTPAKKVPMKQRRQGLGASQYSLHPAAEVCCNFFIFRLSILVFGLIDQYNFDFYAFIICAGKVAENTSQKAKRFDRPGAQCQCSGSIVNALSSSCIDVAVVADFEESSAFVSTNRENTRVWKYTLWITINGIQCRLLRSSKNNLHSDDTLKHLETPLGSSSSKVQRLSVLRHPISIIASLVSRQIFCSPLVRQWSKHVTQCVTHTLTTFENLHKSGTATSGWQSFIKWFNSSSSKRFPIELYSTKRSARAKNIARPTRNECSLTSLLFWVRLQQLIQCGCRLGQVFETTAQAHHEPPGPTHIVHTNTHKNGHLTLQLNLFSTSSATYNRFLSRN